MRAHSALWTVLLVLAILVPAAVAEQPEVPWEVLDQRPGQGEQCIVCGHRKYGEAVLEIRYQGRTFYVAEAMLRDFEEEPDRYFRKLQALSALFDERAVGGGRPSLLWVVIGAYLVVGLVSAALCGFLAISKSVEPLPWFFAGLVGNVAALAVLLATRSSGGGAGAAINGRSGTLPPSACPACGAGNHPAAERCTSCGQPLTPQVEAETRRV